jgi:hypothetical protein
MRRFWSSLNFRLHAIACHCTDSGQVTNLKVDVQRVTGSILKIFNYISLILVC